MVIHPIVVEIFQRGPKWQTNQQTNMLLAWQKNPNKILKNDKQNKQPSLG